MKATDTVAAVSPICTAISPPKHQLTMVLIHSLQSISKMVAEEELSRNERDKVTVQITLQV